MIKDIQKQAVEHHIDIDLEDNKELQEIIELASAVCNTPYAMITLLDKSTQYLKVKKSTNKMVIPLETSFCHQSVLTDDLVIVNDIHLDERFSNGPLFIKGFDIGFYAGMPLITNDGEKVGSLCLLNPINCSLTENQRLMLKILSSQVIKIIELKLGLEILEKNQIEVERQQKLINDADIRLRSFFESSANFQVLLDRNGEVIDFNKTAFNFIKTVHKTDLKRGDLFIPYLAPAFVSIFIDRYKLALEGKKCLEEGSTDYGELGVIWWEANFEPAKDQFDNIIGISYLIRNVTERKLKEQKILDQNQSLLKIAHIQAHEFRAPLTTIMGLMNLIKEEDYKAPAEYFEFLEQAVANLDFKIKQIVMNIENNMDVE